VEVGGALVSVKLVRDDARPRSVRVRTCLGAGLHFTPPSRLPNTARLEVLVTGLELNRYFEIRLMRREMEEPSHHLGIPCARIHFRA
jgi:hypothetical protein